MMTNEQYSQLIDMLVESTTKNLLTWSRDNGSASFYTKVNNCRLELRVFYDVAVKDNKAWLEMYNVDGCPFNKYIFSEKVDKGEFDRLSRLNEIVKDKFYKVTESEQRIMQGLNDLLKLPEG